MPKTKIHWFAYLLVVVGFVFGSLVLVTRTHEARAQVVGPICPGTNSITIDNITNTTSAPIYPGPHHVVLSMASTLAPVVQSVNFTLDGQTNLLGKGNRVGTNMYWDMTWYSQVTPVGSHAVSATVAMTSGSCTVSPVPAITTTTTAAGVLAATATPSLFNELPGNSKDFLLGSGVTVGTMRYDVTSWTVFTKTPSALGVITPVDDGNAFRFTAGTVLGEAMINVIARYGGVSRPLTIPVKVYAQAVANTSPVAGGTNTTNATPKTAVSGSTTATPTPTSTAAGSTAPATTTTTQPTSVVLASSPLSVDTDAPAKLCVLTKLSLQRYEAINSGADRPTAAEFEAFRQCFEVRKYVLPANLVPVPADKTKLKQQPVSSGVSVASISNPTEKSTTTEKLVLKFAGKAKPKATVLLYLFSEPLVVTTSADANGDWSYSLNDPMEPGKHEAYALVNKGDGNYERSSVFAFAIAKATAAAANPNGYSLKIEKNQATAVDNTAPVKLYVGAVSGLIILVIAVAIFVVLHRRKPVAESIVDPNIINPGVVAADSLAESADLTTVAPITSAPTESVVPVLYVPVASTAMPPAYSFPPESPPQLITPTQPPPADTPSASDGVKLP